MPERGTLAQFFAELKRRRVIRVLVAYVVAALAALQAASVLVPALHLPGWVTTLVAVLGLVGLPVTLALAWVFDVTPDGVTRTDADPAAATSAGRRAAPIAVAAVVVVALLGGGLWIVFGRGDAAAAEVDAGLFAVLPFRVSGADPSLAYLQEGMVDLLSLKLAGARRAVEPRTLLSAWHRSVGNVDPPLEQAVRFAADLTAGRLVLGSAVGSAQQLTLSAQLYDVPDGETLANASVSGRAEDLPLLIDSLSAKIVSLDAGESEENLAVLTSTSLPALRAYLDAMSQYRRGFYLEAALNLALAVSHDSTFALAALHMGEASAMAVGSTPGADAAAAARVVHAHRGRLSPRDKAYSLALYPDSSDSRSAFERWEDAVLQLPDRAEAWYQLGDLLFHGGAARGIDGSLGRAKDALSRAVALDSTYFAPLHHLVWIAVAEGDTAFAGRVMDEYLLREDPSAEVAAEFRLSLAEMRADSAALRFFDERLDSMPAELLTPLAWAPSAADLLYFDVGRAERAAAIVLARARTPAARASALALTRNLALSTGRPAAAEAALQELERSGTVQQGEADRRRLTSAVFWGADARAAERAAERIGQSGPPVPAVAYALAVWRLAGGEVPDLEPVIAELHASTDVTDRLLGDILEVWRASAVGDPRTRALAEALETTLRTTAAPYEARAQANLVLVRVYEAIGDPARAFAATRRVTWVSSNDLYASTFVRERARLAAALGEREEAIKAHAFYLDLMTVAEPALQAEVDAARAALAALQRGG